MKGKMFREYTVVCALCSALRSYGTVRRYEAEHHARLEGWVNSREHGWVCWKCRARLVKKAG